MRIRRGSIYSRGFRWTGRRKYFSHRQAIEIKSLSTLPRQITQNSRSDVSVHNVVGSGTAPYFDYGSAMLLRNQTSADGTDMPCGLLAPEVAVLLSKVTFLRKRLLVNAL